MEISPCALRSYEFQRPDPFTPETDLAQSVNQWCQNNQHRINRCLLLLGQLHLSARLNTERLSFIESNSQDPLPAPLLTLFDLELKKCAALFFQICGALNCVSLIRNYPDAPQSLREHIAFSLIVILPPVTERVAREEARKSLLQLQTLLDKYLRPEEPMQELRDPSI